MIPAIRPQAGFKKVHDEKDGEKRKMKKKKGRRWWGTAMVVAEKENG